MDFLFQYNAFFFVLQFGYGGKSFEYGKIEKLCGEQAAIVQDGAGIFYGLFVGDKLAYPIEYTKISYDEDERIFTLEKGAEKLRVFMAKNGNLIDLT